MKKKILFNKPLYFRDSLKNISLLNKNNHWSGNGQFTKKCRNWFLKNVGGKEVLFVHSCTAALEMCAILLNTKPGDEIIMPSYTFVSTANAFVLRGGKPIFADIEMNTLCIDLMNIEKLINKNTKAIIAVHYAGISCDMDKLKKICKKYNLYLIEDAAQALLSKYKKKYLGTIGDLATISFHETKNIHCGEGGALIINNKSFIKRARVIRDKGTNRSDFNKNLVKKYTWVDIGSSFALGEINAAFLYGQLINAKKVTKERIQIWMNYYNFFKKQKKFFVVPNIPKYSKTNGHLFYLILKNKNRSLFLRKLKSIGINAIFHYVPLHKSKQGSKFNYKKFDLKVTEHVSKQLIRLPLHYYLNKPSVNQVKLSLAKKIKEL
jgi:dTDP-4-amino-4,6-dideoxygalactose transaminase